MGPRGTLAPRSARSGERVQTEFVVALISLRQNPTYTNPFSSSFRPSRGSGESRNP